jgi:hypothetical protein
MFQVETEKLLERLADNISGFFAALVTFFQKLLNTFWTVKDEVDEQLEKLTTTAAAE